MIAAFLEHTGVVGLLMFFGIFTGIALWVYRPGSSQKYKSYAEIPFREESHD